MATLASLGVIIDPTGATAGGQSVLAILTKMGAAADAMALATNAMVKAISTGSQASATALSTVAPAAIKAETAISGVGTEATAALGKEIVQGAKAGADSLNSISTQAAKTAEMMATLQRSEEAVSGGLTQIASNMWEEEVDGRMIRIIDNSQALIQKTEEQINAENALREAAIARLDAQSGQAKTQAQRAPDALTQSFNRSAANAAKSTPSSDADAEVAAATKEAAAQRAIADAARQAAQESAQAGQSAAGYAQKFAQEGTDAAKAGYVEQAKAAQQSAEVEQAYAKQTAAEAKEFAATAAAAYKDAAAAAKAAGNDESAIAREAASDSADAAKQYAADAADAYKEASQAAKDAASAASDAVKQAAQEQAAAAKEAAAQQAAAAKEAAQAQKEAAQQIAADDKEIAAAATQAAEAQARAFAGNSSTALHGLTDNLHEVSSSLFGLSPLFGSMQGQVTQLAGVLSAAGLGFSKVTGSASDQQGKMAALTAAYERQNTAAANVAKLAQDTTTSEQDLAAAMVEEAAAAEAATVAEDAMAASTGALLVSMLPMLGILAAAGAALLIFVGAYKVFKAAITAGNEFNDLHARLAQFMGDAKGAATELARLQELGAKSGISLPDLESGEQKLLAFGESAKQASEDMNEFATLSARSGQDAINGLVTAFTTARDTGYANMMQIRQLRTQLVDLMPEITKQTGLAGIALRTFLSSGNLTFAQLRAAIKSAADQTDAFAVRLQTPGGMLHKIQTDYEELLTKFGTPISAAIVPFLQMVDDELLKLGSGVSGQGVAGFLNGISGAIKEGQLGTLIWEALTQGTVMAVTWLGDALNKYIIDPIDKWVNDHISVAQWDKALETVVFNMGDMLVKAFREGALYIYASLTVAFTKLTDALASSKVLGLGMSPSNGKTTMSSILDNPSTGLPAIQEDYSNAVSKNNADYQKTLADNGLAVSEVTGALGPFLTGLQVVTDKMTGVGIPKPLTAADSPLLAARANLGATGANLTDEQVQRIVKNMIIVKQPAQAAATSAPVATGGHSVSVAPNGTVTVSGLPTSPISAPAPDGLPAAPSSVAASGVSAGASAAANASNHTAVVAANTEAIKASTEAVKNNANASASAGRAISGVGADFGRLVDGSIDRTDENKAHWNGEAHYGAPVFGRQDLTNPNLMGAAVSPQQAEQLTGLSDATKALQALSGVALVATDSVTHMSTVVRAVDVGPGRSDGQSAVELTGAANRAIGNVDSTGKDLSNAQITLSLAGAHVNVAGQPAYQPSTGNLATNWANYQRAGATGATAVTNINTPSMSNDPSQVFGRISMDETAVLNLNVSLGEYSDALKAGAISQDEYNKATQLAISKTLSGLNSPTGGAALQPGQAPTPFTSQIQKQLTSSEAPNANWQSEVVAHQAAQAQILADSKQADELMKTNDEGVVDSFIQGMQKEAQAVGSLQTNIGKIGQTLTTGLTSGVAGAIQEIATGSKTAAQAFRQMAASMLEDISKLIIEFVLLAIIKQAAGAAGSAIGGTTGAALTSFSNSGGGSSVLAGVHHTGGIVGSPSIMRLMSPDAFIGAPRYHSGGMVGNDEQAIVARKGEGVFTPEQMRSLSPTRGNQTTNNNVTNNFSPTYTFHQDGSQQSSSKNSGNQDDQTQKISEQLDQRIRSVLVDETTRQGGIVHDYLNGSANNV
jgi:hypothetical protein